MHKSEIILKSSGEKTFPVGLWGEFIIIALVFLLMLFFNTSSSML